MYKVNFLIKAKVDEDTLKTTKTTREVIYGEKTLKKRAANWRTLGFKRVLGIECVPDGEGQKCAFSREEVVEMFYPEKEITEKDKKIKDNLLGKVEEPKDEGDDGSDEGSNDDDKATAIDVDNLPDVDEDILLEMLRERAKELSVQGWFNAKKETLIARIKEKEAELKK